MLRILLHTLFLSLTLLACNPDRIQYTDKLKQEMSDKKVRRLTNADLTEAVDSWGEQIVAIAEKEAADELAKGNEAAAICTLQDLPKTQALAKRYGMAISLLGAADLQNQKLSSKEREVLDAYLYNAENKLPQSSNIQRIGDTLFVYNAAVPTGNALSQTCFGKQKEQLAVWRLAFPKQEVIRHMKPKK
ncbi:hypothetical protein [Fibrivirga algicola]|uniref:DUF3347 domain-containing protein n=1 Tax=Fibrivirga algicola TaxID=2950420 RepID=A0ABX0QLL3_9BACT|nr:hypothetical protein [Fibrivirga algicola]NID11917.1 hypothetical protein [Fibrivirga algicola]